MQTRPRPKKYRRYNRKARPEVAGEHGFVLRPYQVVLRPLVTEKGTHAVERYNAYAFEVSKFATKPEIKKAIEELFRVRVEDVRTQIRHGKKRRSKFKIGHQPDWKRAIVKLHPEDRIDFI